MNSDYFVITMLIQLEQAIFPQGRVPRQKRLVAHLDSSRVQTSRGSIDWQEDQGMRLMAYSPYSPDLAPSDFSLFHTGKEKLEWTQVADKN
jgi:hypothetical protein